ncbi:hypothetical protein GA0111570_11726 [Raineyella antarctica]|uniref:Uncharacterized protein n=1 Tax=Raineyella antarctica TaxID=1577474 RepID=A0A1G6IJT9_9ACTN|nr:hypothetical protein [Raineyella antarctica]SDC06693.1 hypothetical protein GA0111570_11726 [Raineyella antarctica]
MSSAASGRRAASSPARKLTIGILVAGLLVAAALAIGTVWVVRAGVLLAAATAVASVLLAWREASIERRAAARKDLDQARSQGLELSRERRSNISVVNSLESRNNAIASRVDDLSTEIRTLRAEIATLRKLKSEMSQTIAVRDVEMSSLRQDLQKAHAELQHLLADEAEVYALPRRGTMTEDSSPVWAAVPTAEELWSDGDHPTVVDMKALAYPEPAPEQRRHA